jgi:hypothetical protein
MVDEGALAADLHHRQPLAILALEPGIARDVDLDQLEPELVARAPERLLRALAQVTPGRVIQRDGQALTDTAPGSSSPRRRA